MRIFKGLCKFFVVSFSIFCCFLFFTSEEKENPQLPIGMNLDSYNYYSLALVFADVMKSAGEMMTYNATGSSPWNTEKNNEIPKDPQGYPL